ncbi:hypothetical protein B23_0984 [Geobacillus thermoleovorans B23]|nr:hypothetical protein B23_0984 [Geobacillus thermoleovorans B23]
MTFRRAVQTDSDCCFATGTTPVAFFPTMKAKKE